MAVFAKYNNTSPFDGEWYIIMNATNQIGGADDGVLIQLLDASPTTRKRAETNTALTADAWNTVFIAWDGTKSATGGFTALINGSSSTLTETEDGFDALYNRAGDVTIGAGLTDTIYDSYVDGPLCHVFFHQAERSAAWGELFSKQVLDNYNAYTWASAGEPGSVRRFSTMNGGMRSIGAL